MPHNDTQSCPLCKFKEWLCHLEQLRDTLAAEVNVSTGAELVMGATTHNLLVLTRETKLLRCVARAYDNAMVMYGTKKGELWQGLYLNILHERWKKSMTPEDAAFVLKELTECEIGACAVACLLSPDDAKVKLGEFAFIDGPYGSIIKSSPGNVLHRDSLMRILGDWRSSTYRIAKLGFVRHGDGYSDDHTFIIARYEGHYALYQSWVSRFFLFERPPPAAPHVIPDIWDMDEGTFESLLGRMTGSGPMDSQWRRALFAMTGRDKDVYGAYRIVAWDYSPVKAQQSVHRNLPSIP